MILWTAGIFGAVLGALVGSFLNVCVHRLPRNESIVHPPSRCYGCGSRIRWYDNLPIISYLLLRGRCRRCGSSYHWRYLAFEVGIAALTALVTVAVLSDVRAFLPLWMLPMIQQGPEWLLHAGVGIALAACLAFTYLLAVSAVIDCEHMIIPDELTKGWQVVALPLALCVAPIGLQMPVLGVHLWPTIVWFDAGSLGAVVLGLAILSAVVLPLTMPMARWIYTRRVPVWQRWDERDFRSFNLGILVFLACVVVAGPIPLLIGTGGGGPTAGFAISDHLSLQLGHAILGMIAGWCLPYCIGLGGTIAFGRNALGYGDVKFLAPIGALVGPVGLLYVFAIAACIGTAVGVPLRLFGKGVEIPFGPFLAIGAFVTRFWGPDIHRFLWF